MHESVLRLLQCAKEATKTAREPVADFADLARKLGVSSAVMTNWKARGVSKEGAIKAEQVFGCSAQWVLTGERPAGGAEDEEESAPLAGQALVLEDALRSLGQEAREDVLEYIKMKIARSKAPHVQEMRKRYMAALDKVAKRAANDDDHEQIGSP